MISQEPFLQRGRTLTSLFTRLSTQQTSSRTHHNNFLPHEAEPEDLAELLPPGSHVGGWVVHVEIKDVPHERPALRTWWKPAIRTKRTRLQVPSVCLTGGARSGCSQDQMEGGLDLDSIPQSGQKETCQTCSLVQVPPYTKTLGEADCPCCFRLRRGFRFSEFIQCCFLAARHSCVQCLCSCALCRLRIDYRCQ